MALGIIIMCIIYFTGWMYLQWEVLKTSIDNSKKSAWIVLCSMGSALCAFLCGVILVKLLFL